MKQLADLLITPTVAFKEIAEQKPWMRGILIIVLVAVMGAFVSLPNKKTLDFLPLSLASPLIFTLATMPFLIVLGFLRWFVFSLLSHGVAKLFGGKGSFSSTLLVFAYSELPFLFLILVVPLGILRLYPLPAEMPSLSAIFIGLFQFALAVWSIVLIIIGLREVHFFRYPQAVGAACLPPCGCLFVGVVLAISLVAFGVISAANFLGR